MSVRPLILHTAGAAAALVAAAMLTATAAPNFIITPLVVQGDFIPGIGFITTIDSVGVSDGGRWIVEADTDHPDTTRDRIIIRDGLLFLRENDPLAAPAGASIRSFDSVRINDSGDVGWNLFLNGTAGSSDDSGLFLNDSLIVQESTDSTAPQFSMNTRFLGFFEARLNDADQLVAMCSVDDPNIPSTVDRAIIRFDISRSRGVASFTETVIAKEGDLLPGQTEPVADFGTGTHAFALNNEGDVMFVADLTGDTQTDGCIYINDTLIAQEGGPSLADAGNDRGWLTLASAVVDLNNHGGYVFRATQGGDPATNLVIWSNGAVVVQESDALPAIGKFNIENFGSTAPVFIDDSGDVFWHGNWNDPDTSRDAGLFRNHELLVQEGVTMIDGATVAMLPPGDNTFHVSPNGQNIIFEATLLDGRNGAFLLKFLPSDCPADLDGDGQVGSSDLALVLGSWGPGGGPADLDGDGVVGSADLALLLGSWGACD